MTKITSKLLEWLPKGKFARAVTILSGGTLLGQGLIIISSPLLTRLYTPEDFGVWAVFASLLLLLSVIATGRYELAIPLPEDESTALHLVALCLLVVVSLSLLTLFIVLHFNNTLVTLLNTPELGSYLWLLAVGLFAAGLYQTFNYWAVRQKAFSKIASTKFNQGLGTVVVQLGLGLLRFGPVGLLLGQIVGQSAGTMTLSPLIWQRNRSTFSNLRGSSLKNAAIRYRNFPLFASWLALINSLNLQAPILMLSALFGPVVSGLFILSYRVLQAPMTLLGSAISQVFLSEGAERLRQGELAKLTLDIFEKLVRFGLGIIVLIGVVAPELFAFVFGSEWRPAGIYAQWLTPWLFFVFITSPLSTLTSILEKQSIGLIFVSLFLISSIAAIIIGAQLKSALVAIALFGAVNAVTRFGFMTWLLHISGNSLEKPIRLITKELLLVLAIISPVILVKALSIDTLYLITVMALCGGFLALRSIAFIRG